MPSLTTAVDGALPVSSDADVLQLLPHEYREEETAPVRDALVHAHATQQEFYQEKADYAAAQSDIGRATGRYLQALGADRGFRKQDNESNDEFRSRTLAVPDLVTPGAIVDAVNAILAEVGAGECEYLESIADRLYVNETGGTGICAGVVGATPINPTRLYPEDEAVNGAARPNASPGAAWTFDDHVGRFFVLRVPNLASLDSALPTPWSSSSTAPNRSIGRGSLFLRTSVGLANHGYLYANASTALDTYKRICDTVAAIVGHSIRWMMISDTTL
jgi:hypothetical protein